PAVTLERRRGRVGRCVLLPATSITATAVLAARDDRHVPELARDPAGLSASTIDFAADHKTDTDTRSRPDQDEVTHQPLIRITELHSSLIHLRRCRIIFDHNPYPVRSKLHRDLDGSPVEIRREHKRLPACIRHAVNTHPDHSKCAIFVPANDLVDVPASLSEGDRR